MNDVFGTARARRLLTSEEPNRFKDTAWRVVTAAC